MALQGETVIAPTPKSLQSRHRAMSVMGGMYSSIEHNRIRTTRGPWPLTTGFSSLVTRICTPNDKQFTSLIIMRLFAVILIILLLISSLWMHEIVTNSFFFFLKSLIQFDEAVVIVRVEHQVHDAKKLCSSSLIKRKQQLKNLVCIIRGIFDFYKTESIHWVT